MKQLLKFKKIVCFTILIVIGFTQLHAQAVSFQWAQKIGASNYDAGSSITTDASGNVYTTGVFVGTMDFDPGPGISMLTSAGGYDTYISKLDSAGNFIWVKQLRGTLYEWINTITVDASANLYITGFFSGTADFDPDTSSTYNLSSAGAFDIFVSKLDSSGTFIWAKQFGGVSFDIGYSVAVDASGNVYSTGIFQDTVDFDPGTATYNLTSAGLRDIYISKLDTSGNFVWAKRIGSDLDDYGEDIAVDPSGNVYVAGGFQHTADFDPGGGTHNLTSTGGFDVFVSELDAAGNFLGAQSMGGSADDFANTIARDASGNIYTAGTFESVADFDPGATNFNLTAAQDDIFISKLDASGNFVWAKQMGGPLYDEATSISLDQFGNIYTVGDFLDTADFDPGAGTSYLMAEGTDVFISKLNPSGNFMWAKQVSGSFNEFAPGLATDNFGGVYCAGEFKDTADFDPGTGVYDMISAGNSDAFTLKLGQPVITGVNENRMQDNDISAFPNPSNGPLNLSCRHSLDHATIRVTDLYGRTIMEQTNMSGNKFSFDFSGLANGIYLIKIISADQVTETEKIVKQ